MKNIDKETIEIISTDDIIKAYRDCSRHKKHSESYLKFDLNRFPNLVKLKNELNSQTYEIGYSICFIVSYPKLREVFAADFRDRIVHHVIINKFNDLFESFFIPESFNCRKGKGTSHGIETIQEYIREMTDNYTSDCWVLKCDIRNFFMSIEKEKLAEWLEHFIRTFYHDNDVDWWVSLIKQVALHKPQFKCIKKGDLYKWELIESGKTMFKNDDKFGMAIGNLTSQIFANFYLTPFDHFIKHFKYIRYGRYVDDFVIIGKNKKQILQIMKMARNFLYDTYGFMLHPDKWTLYKASQGFQFLGSIIKLNRQYIITRTINSAIEAAHDEKLSINKYSQRLNSYLGFMYSIDSYDIRKKIWHEIPESRLQYLYNANRIRKITIKNKYIFKIIKD